VILGFTGRISNPSVLNLLIKIAVDEMEIL
jgi:hypothetical protein